MARGKGVPCAAASSAAMSACSRAGRFRPSPLLPVWTVRSTREPAQTPSSCIILGVAAAWRCISGASGVVVPHGSCGRCDSMQACKSRAATVKLSLQLPPLLPKLLLCGNSHCAEATSPYSSSRPASFSSMAARRGALPGPAVVCNGVGGDNSREVYQVGSIGLSWYSSPTVATVPVARG